MPGRREHSEVGQLAGLVAAAAMGPAQHPLLAAAEIIGGGFGGHCGALLPDVFDPATGPAHRTLGHGVVPATWVGTKVVGVVCRYQTVCRENAAACVRQLATPPVPLERLVLGLGVLLWHVAAGFVVCLPAGYASHLVLDGGTRRGLPLLA